jgi:TPR repeat protein
VTGDGRAQYALGLLHAFEAEPRDYIQAYRWLDMAAATKPYAEAARDAIALKMTEDEIADARKNKAATLSRTDKAPQ